MVKLVALSLAVLFVVAILALFIVLPIRQGIVERRHTGGRYGPPRR